MLVEIDEGHYLAGPLDRISILKDVTTGRYHACFFEEHPPPGPILPVDQIKVIRLKSKMHHTTGAATEAEALEQLAELRQTIDISDERVDPAPVDWDGEWPMMVFESR